MANLSESFKSFHSGDDQYRKGMKVVLCQADLFIFIF